VGGKGSKKGERNFKFGRTISTAAVHDGLCYVADMTGLFFCFDAKTGQKLWDPRPGGPGVVFAVLGR